MNAFAEIAARRAWAWPVARLGLFALCTVLLTFRHLERIGTTIPGNPGDAYIVLAFLEWGGDHSVRLFQDFWAGPIFSTSDRAMAYSEAMLPLAFPFWLLERTTGSRVVAFNTLFLVSWVIAAESTYHLALRFVRSRPVAVTAALAFTFSTIRLAQTGHFQLAWTCFLPLAVLQLLRLRERPSVGRGGLAALAVLAQMLTSAYHGVILIVFAGVFAVGEVVRAAARRRDWRPVLGGWATMLALIGVVMLPFQRIYAAAHDEVLPRSVYPEWAELRLGDWRMPTADAWFPRLLPFFDHSTEGRFGENYAYLGIFVLALLPVLAVLALAPGWRHRLPKVSVEWVAVIALGAFAMLLAFGRGPLLGVPLPFYDIATAIIPGFESIVALVRLFVFAQLALVLLAAAALEGLVRDRPRALRIGAVAAVGLLVVVDSWQRGEFIEVVEPEQGSVYAAMQELPAGNVVELPMVPTSAGILYAFAEATRMVLGTDDALRSFNGYSGYTPIGYDASIALLNDFPSAASIDELDRLGIDYVTIHTAPIDTGHDGVSAAINGAGIAFWPADEVQRRLSSAPEGRVDRRIDATDGVVVVLRGD